MFVYDFLIGIYVFAIRVSSLFNYKAKLWIEGRRDIFKKLADFFDKVNQPVVWFHCASLGEFEQGRPLIEEFKRRFPEYKILLTFFSPSGYEVRKDYKGADFVCYLPADTYGNAKKFLDIVKPEKVFFVKYEYWRNYLDLMKKRKIDVYLVSALFRENQIFFKKYGGFFRKILMDFVMIFVQDKESERLLNQIGIDNVLIAGDTRFDRVYATAKTVSENLFISDFCGNSKVVLCGSTWPLDEDIIVDLIKSDRDDMKFIIVPHEVDKAHITAIKNKINRDVLLYSEGVCREGVSVLIVDTIGILSQIYRYAWIAYIGGGFGVGIHNILEAATFAKPVFFGPNYNKFKEAVDLIELGGAVSVNGSKDLMNRIDVLKKDEGIYYERCKISGAFVKNNTGATSVIFDNIK